MQSYRQYCPVALAAEIVGRRWTPLVVRELLLGSRRFNDIHRGVPRMSRTLLSTRLDELEEAGLLQRVVEDGHPEYRLTRAGEELGPIIMELGAWGKRWVRTKVTREHLDVGYLMWDVRRRVDPDALPRDPVVVHFHFTDADDGEQDFWLVLEAEAVDLCLKDPGYDCDLRLVTDVRTMVDVWMGDDDLGGALRDRRIRLRGPEKLRRRFPDWLGLSHLAHVERAQ
ncbi:MAG: helix-turn-helix domain-containing protein [Gemmatimonadota bacterium]